MINSLAFSEIIARHFLSGGGDKGAYLISKEYLNRMLADISYRPPLVICTDQRSYWLAANYPLYLAYEIIDEERVFVNLTRSSELGAILVSVSAEANPWPRSCKNIRACIVRLLQHNLLADWDDVAIANAVGSSADFVSHVRLRLTHL